MGLMGVASLYKSMELRGGGGVVARALGGVRIARDTSDLKRKRLLNVVEEMAIASGVPMPEVYVLEQEPAINAFRSEEHTSELQSRLHLVCRLLLEKKKKKTHASSHVQCHDTVTACIS